VALSEVLPSGSTAWARLCHLSRAPRLYWSARPSRPYARNRRTHLSIQRRRLPTLRAISAIETWASRRKSIRPRRACPAGMVSDHCQTRNVCRSPGVSWIVMAVLRPFAIERPLQAGGFETAKGTLYQTRACLLGTRADNAPPTATILSDISLTDEALGPLCIDVHQAGIVNVSKIAPRRLSLEKMCACVRGENAGVRESTKPCIGLYLLYRCAIFCLHLTIPAAMLSFCLTLRTASSILGP
jgi:hypothetical protein